MATYLYATGSSPVLVRDPDNTGFRRSNRWVGEAQRAINGGLSMSGVDKYVWDLVWTGLTNAENLVLLPELRRRVVMTWVPPDNTDTYQVLVVGDIQRNRSGGVNKPWVVTAHLEQI